MEIRVVSDQICRPTWTHTLAEFLYYLVEEKCDCGIYHCSDDALVHGMNLLKKF